jgi:hypothetical protein
LRSSPELGARRRCIIRLVAIVDPKGSYRIEKGEKL